MGTLGVVFSGFAVMLRVQDASPIVPATQMDTSSSNAEEAKAIQLEMAVGQVVLKLDALPVRQWHWAEPSTSAIAAMQALMAVVNQMRSPTSGWHPDRPQTPDHLLPYVLEEACTLLEALEASLDLPSSMPETVEQDSLLTLWSRPSLVEQVASPLLWGIARSAHSVMRLLEGIAAEVEINGIRKAGMLRLAAVLQIETSMNVQVYDLVTRQVGRSPLPSTVQIYTLADDLLPQPMPAHDLLQELSRQIRFSTPHLIPVLDSVNVNVLAPGQLWQAGTLRLQLGFDFVATFLPLPHGPLAHVPPAQPAQLTTEASLSFTDSNWLEAYNSIVLQQQLNHLMTQLAGCQTVAIATLPLPADQVLPLLVQDACDALNLLANPLSTSLYLKLQGTLQFSRFLGQLLWSMSRSTPALMTLMGGVRCALLQPEANWETGMLRLLVSLTIKTPVTDWFYDLATGKLPEPSIFPLAPDVVLQLENSAWCPHPTLLQDLETQLLQQIQTAAPELRLLLAGTTIDWLDTTGEEQPATLQLQIDFDFMPI